MSERERDRPAATSTPRERRDHKKPTHPSLLATSSDVRSIRENTSRSILIYTYATGQKMLHLHVLDQSPGPASSYIYISTSTYLLTCTLLAQRKLAYNKQLGNGNLGVFFCEKGTAHACMQSSSRQLPLELLGVSFGACLVCKFFLQKTTVAQL
jgi:hypothetical protein